MGYLWFAQMGNMKFTGFNTTLSPSPNLPTRDTVSARPHLGNEKWVRLAKFSFSFPICNGSLVDHISVTHKLHAQGQHFATSPNSHICDPLMIRPSLSIWKMNIILDQSKESNPVVSLGILLKISKNYIKTSILQNLGLRKPEVSSTSEANDLARLLDPFQDPRIWL